MINSYLAYNEGKSMKNRRGSNRGRNQKYQDSFNQPTINRRNLVEDFDMPLHLSPRLEYIINKMAETGNPISKEILKAVKDGRVFELSYLDMSRNVENFTFLTKEIISLDSFKEEDAYKTNKRSTAKVFKALRLLFDNKFTKNEIQKFVSVYKSVYSKGPDKSILKTNLSDQSSKNISIEETVKKLISGTKEGKLKWSPVNFPLPNKKYRLKVPITSIKHLEIDFYIFSEGMSKNNFISFNIFDGHKINSIKSINFEREKIEDLCIELEKYV